MNSPQKKCLSAINLDTMVGQKGLEEGFPVEEKRKTYLRSYLLTYFENSPAKPTSALLLGQYTFFRGFRISGLVQAVLQGVPFMGVQVLR